MSITLTGFYCVGGRQWARWLLCLLGFFIARRIARRLAATPPPDRSDSAMQERHAA
jgi:hypothetical protein